MTKIRNTKKGMAKKTLSISLAVAMLATSNVPVWAAEDLFTDGAAIEFTSEVEAPVEVVEEETPVVTEEIEAPEATSVVTENDVTVNLKTSSTSLIWGKTAKISGTIVSKDGTVLAPSYRWLNQDNVVAKDEDGNELKGDFVLNNVGKITDISLVTDAALAGQTLTLYVSQSGDDIEYDINTGITVEVKKRSLKTATILDPNVEYNAFPQSAPTDIKADVKDSEGVYVLANDYEIITSSTAVNKDDAFTVTVTAKDDSAYIGSIDKTFTIKARKYRTGDIIASTTEGQSFQYTGSPIKVTDVALKESQSVNNGADEKLNGNDLSNAIKTATTVGSNVGNHAVNVSIDTTKLSNFVQVPGSLSTGETVEITKRDLSAAGTNISVNYGKIETGSSIAQLKDQLVFKGTEGADLTLVSGSDYNITVKDPEGNDVTTILDKTGVYTVTISSIATGNCTGSQTFVIETVANVIMGADWANMGSYYPSYTGSEIKPTKSDIGTLTVHGTAGTETLQDTEWEITGYTNNVNAATYKNINGSVPNGERKTQAYVNIKVLKGKYLNETLALPFEILPLQVTADTIAVPGSVTYKEDYTKPEQYNVPVTVVAKDRDKKITKTLTADDFTVKYSFVNGKNELHDRILAEVTVTNKNYIWGSTDGNTYVVSTAGQETTEIVANALTDAMISINPTSYTYTGGKITPTYTVMDGVLVLYKDTEYKEVSITDAVNVGTGKVTIEGLDPYYSGRASATFEIVAANTEDVNVEIADQDYTGRQVRPREFKATLNGNDVTSQFAIVSYGENIEAGKGTVVLQAKAGNKNFVGNNITTEFNIVKEQVKGKINLYDAKGYDITNNDAAKTFTFDGNEKKFAKEVLSGLTKADGKTATTAKASDFEIKYADNVTGKGTGKNIAWVYAVAKEGTGFSGTDTITTSDGTVIKGVVAKVPFFITAVRFVKQNITIKNGTYAGGLPVKPEVMIQIGGTTLVEGKDFTFTVGGDSTNRYTEVTSNNPYTIEITGKGGYSSSKIPVAEGLKWGIDKKNLAECIVTVKDGVANVSNGYLPVPTTEYTTTNNGDGTYTVTAAETSKNYVGSKTVDGEGLVDNKPAAPMLVNVKVDGNKATAVLSGESEGAIGYDYVIGTSRDCIETKDYVKVNKNKLTTDTTFTYVQQGQYYAYCHAWTRDENGKKVFSEWSNAYPFVVTAITPETPAITDVKVKGNTVTVVYTKAANATGYDVVLGTELATISDEKRPVKYGELVKKNIKGNTVTATFKNVPEGTYFAGLHAFNRTSEDGKKVFSPWANWSKKVTVK